MGSVGDALTWPLLSVTVKLGSRLDKMFVSCRAAHDSWSPPVSLNRVS
jgi:hypothetical protein